MDSVSHSEEQPSKRHNDNFFIPSLVGSYTIDSSENVNEYLKSLGVGLVFRKILSVAQPICIISFEPATEQWTVIMKSVFRTKEATFKLMEKFSDETFESRKCQSYVEILENGRIMKWYQECEEGPNVEMTLTSTESGFTEVHKCGELQCEFKYRHGLPLNQLRGDQ